MSILTRSTIAALALAAMMSAAQAQTTTRGQEHDSHHPGGTPAPVQAQPQPQSSSGMTGGMMGNMGQMMPMMRQMMMGQQGGMMGGMGMPFEHVEGRIAFLRTELRITDSQMPQWNSFADALRAGAKAHQSMHEQMTKATPATWPDRLAAQQAAMAKRLDSLRALEAAARPLYAVLSDEQKALADRLLSGPMGMM